MGSPIPRLRRVRAGRRALYSYEDTFDDGVVGGTTYIQAGGAIAESGGTLNVSITAEGAQCNWWSGGGEDQAPQWRYALPAINSATVDVRAKLVSFTSSAAAMCSGGLCLFKDLDNVYMTEWSEDNDKINAVQIVSNVASVLANAAGTFSTPQVVSQVFRFVWNKTNSNLSFYYSLDNEASWTLLHSKTIDFVPTHAVLFCKNWGGTYPSVTAKYEYLKIRLD